MGKQKSQGVALDQKLKGKGGPSHKEQGSTPDPQLHGSSNGAGFAYAVAGILQNVNDNKQHGEWLGVTKQSLSGSELVGSAHLKKGK